MLLKNRLNIEGALLPKDITGAAPTGQWICVKNYSHVTILLGQGARAGGPPAVTMLQAQNVSGLNAKALPFTKRYQQAWNSGTAGYAETAVTNNTFPLPATANQVHLLEIDTATLDGANGFDCMQVNLATPGANADLLAALYLLSGSRYSDAIMPNALVN